jgi:hypothetical protein
MLNECTLERMEAAGSGGTAELLAWIVTLAFTRGPADVLAYMPAMAWRSGTGMVVWNEIDMTDAPARPRADPPGVEQRAGAAADDRPGDTVVFDTRDAANLFYSKASTHDDVLRRGPFSGHPLTGPVAVRGARPGDTLVVEILDVQPALDWGWTAIRPGRGLLPEQTSPSRFCRSGISATSVTREWATAWPCDRGVPRRHGRGPGGNRAGTARCPPRRSGGNMDIRQLTSGATLFLPVLSPAPCSAWAMPTAPRRRRGVHHRGAR